MMMKAMEVTYKTGKAQLTEIAKPTPKNGQVLVKVHYSALDPAADAVIQKTFTGSFTHARTTPLILGWHFGGRVVGVGENVESFDIEDQVWGFLQYSSNQTQGAFSEYIVVDEQDVALKPDNVSLDVLAAASTEALTSLQALRDLGGLKEKQSVLILGAGGGVGSVAVGIAKQLGAHVTAACSTKDVDRVQKLGADRVVDRVQQDVLVDDDTKYDVIFDTPSVYSVPKCLKKLKNEGVYVSTMPSMSLLGGMLLSLLTSKSVKIVMCHSKREDLELVGQWLANGNAEVVIDSTFAIRDLQKALDRQRDCSKVGRVVIQVKDGWDQ